MSLTTTSISRPVTTAMFFLGIALLGAITFNQIGVDFLPAIQLPELLVETDFKGAPAKEVEKTVTKQIESVVTTVGGVRNTSSVSKDGRSLVTVRFYWGTNVDYAMLEVREKLDETRGTLPDNVGRPTIFRIDPSAEPIMTLAANYRQSAVSGQSPAANYESRLAQLKEFVESVVKRRLEQLQGVSQAAVGGGAKREITVSVDMKKLASFGLTLQSVAKALKSSNVNLEGGTITQGVFRYSLRTVGELQTINDIRNVVVASNSVRVPIYDIAEVRESFAEREGFTRLNGKESVLIYVKKEANTNTIAVSKKVHEVIGQLNADYPSTEIRVVFDQAEFIGKSIADIEQAIVFGAFLALMVLFLFLGNPRYLFMIAIVTPLSILATVLLMYISGINFNIISLTGLALGIGMIGDNAIIIIENFSRLRETGYGIREAVIEGSKEINLSVAASTFTNVAVFLPVIFVKGIAQKLFLDMALTMTFSLLASLFVAVTIVPVFLARLKSTGDAARSSGVPVSRIYAEENGPHGFLRSMPGAAYKRLMERYLSFLGFSLDHSFWVLGGTLVLAIFSAGAAFLIKTEQAPDIDQSRFVVLLDLPAYASLEATDEAVQKVEDVLLKMPEISAVASNLGTYTTEDYYEVLNSSINNAKIECRVNRGYSVAQAVGKLRGLIRVIDPQLSGLSADVVITRPSTTFERILEPRRNDLDVEIIGRDLAASMATADSVVRKMKRMNFLTDIGIEGQPTSREIWFIMDKTAARSYGVDLIALADQITNLFQGVVATELDRFDEKYVVKVAASTDHRHEDMISNVLNYNVSTASGEIIPIRNLVNVEERRGYSSITHEDQQRAVVIHANLKSLGLIGGASEVRKILAGDPAHGTGISLPPGLQLKIGGKVEDIRSTFTGLLIIVLLSVFMVYVILASEYESVLYPLVILTSSPLALVGAFIFMFIFNQSYNLMSIIGIVIMLGAIDNDAVIAVDMIISNRRKGMPVKDAIIEGMHRRFRPIVMTTLTSILGVVPLVLGIGKGLELAEALSYPIIGGLIGSTVFTLLLIPVLYKYFDRLSRDVRGPCNHE